MALFSDIDWVIIAAVGVLLLFGSKNGGGVMRTIGRYYARMMSMKQAFLGVDSTSPDHVSGVPAMVSIPPSVPYRPTYQPEVPWTGDGLPTPTWSVVLPPVAADPEAAR